MEVRQLYAFLRRWVWLLILGLVLGGAAGYFFASRQTPVYRASTKILIIYASQQTTSDYTNQYFQDLASTYMQMLSTKPIIDAVSKSIDYPVSSGSIQGQIISDPDVVQISAEDSDPKRAALIANTLVKVLAQQNETYQSGRYTQLEDSIQTQINQVESQSADLQKQINQASNVNLQDQIKQTEDQINSLQTEISTLQVDINSLSTNLSSTNPSGTKLSGTIQPTPTISVEDQTNINEKMARLAQLQPLLAKYQEVYSNLVVIGQPSTTGDGDKLAQLQKTLDLYQQMYLQLLGNLESVRLASLQNTSTAEQIEPAIVPSSPISPKKTNNALLGGAIGLIIMAGAAFLVEYLDDTLKNPRDIKKILNLTVMGYIAEMNHKGKGEPSLHVAKQPRSPVSEAFRTLRTNLEFAGAGTRVRTILVTSTGSQEGKTTISVNLAAIMAMGGKKVLLVDADLRKPTVHKNLGLSNRMGLSDLLRKDTNPQSFIQQYERVAGLNVMTSGSKPLNPTELLGSEKMGTLLQSYKNSMDIIIIDSPPFIVADAQVMSAKVDGVLLVIKPGQTHSGAALTMIEQLRDSGANLLGVVLNDIRRNLSYDYGMYHYYYYKRGHPYYYASENEPQLPSGEAIQESQNSPAPVEATGTSKGVSEATLPEVAGKGSRSEPTPAETSSANAKPFPDWMVGVATLVVEAAPSAVVTADQLVEGRQPLAEQAVTEQPVVEHRISEQPVSEQPVSEQAVSEQPVSEQAVWEQPVPEQPVSEQAVWEQPVLEQPVSEQPVLEQNVLEQPVSEKSILEQPVSAQAVSEQPVPKQAGFEQAVLAQPILEQAVPEQPVLEQPISEQPILEQAVSEQAVLEQPVSEQPVSEQAVSEQAVPELPVLEQAVPEQSVLNQPVSEQAISEQPIPEPKQAAKSIPVIEPASISVQNPIPPLTWKLTGKLSPVPVNDKDAGLLSIAQALLDQVSLNESMNQYSKLIKKGHLLDEVIYDLREGTHRHPVNVDIWQTLGDAYVRANRLQDALNVYTKAEELLR